jgi:hypothetical protein
VASVIPSGVFAWQVLRLRQWLVDDALISMAYARTLAASGRWAQTVSDPQVEGVSNPAWTLMLAGLKRLGLFDSGGSLLGFADYLVVFRVLTLVAFVAVHLLLARAVAKILPGAGQLVSAAAMLMLATSTPFVVWMASGLENPLYAVVVAALAAGLVRWHQTDRLISPGAAVSAGLLAFAAAVTRPDGLIFVAAYPLAVLAGARRRQVRGGLLAIGVHLGVCAVGLAALFGWRYATFAAWVPNTAVAKGQGLDLVASLRRTPELAGALSWPWLALLVAGTVAVFVARATSRRVVMVASVPVVLSACAYLILEKDWMGEYRFATPLLVSAAVLTAVVAAAWLAPRPEPAGRVVTAVAAAALTVAVVGSSAVMFPRMATFIPGPTVGECRIVERYGRLFNFYADELHLGRETLALPDIGGTLLVSRLRVLDLAGLTEPTIARYLGVGDAKGLADYVFETQRPALMNLHGSWTAPLRSDPRLKRDYVRLASEGDWVRRDIAERTPNFSDISKAGGELLQQVEKRYQAQLSGGCGALTVGEPLRP